MFLKTAAKVIVGGEKSKDLWIIPRFPDSGGAGRFSGFPYIFF